MLDTALVSNRSSTGQRRARAHPGKRKRPPNAAAKPEPLAAPPWYESPIIGVALISLVALLVGWRTLNFHFVADDFSQMLQSPAVKQHDWSSIWSQGTWQLLGLPETNYFRPIQVSLFTLEYALFGEHSWGYHLIQVVLYMVTGALWYLYWRRLGVAFEIAAAAGLLWVSHPGNSATLAWIACSADMLTLLFGIGALWFWTLSETPLRWFAGSALWLLALLSKEWAVLLPVLAAGAMVARSGRFELAVLVRRFWSTIAAFIAWLAFRALVVHGVLAPTAMESLSAKTKVFIVAGLCKQYLSTLVVFSHPALWPTLWPDQYVKLATLVEGFAGLLFVVLWAVWLWSRGQRLACWAALSALIALAPAMNITYIPWPVVFNARYLFFVTPFYLLALTSTLFMLASKRIALAGCLIIACISAWVQVPEISAWHNQGTFFQEAARRSPDSPAAFLHLGKLRSYEGRHGQPEEVPWALSDLRMVVALTQNQRRNDLLGIRISAMAERARIQAWQQVQQKTTPPAH